MKLSGMEPTSNLPGVGPGIVGPVGFVGSVEGFVGSVVVGSLGLPSMKL